MALSTCTQWDVQNYENLQLLYTLPLLTLHLFSPLYQSLAPLHPFPLSFLFPSLSSSLTSSIHFPFSPGFSPSPILPSPSTALLQPGTSLAASQHPGQSAPFVKRGATARGTAPARVPQGRPLYRADPLSLLPDTRTKCPLWSRRLAPKKKRTPFSTTGVTSTTERSISVREKNKWQTQKTTKALSKDWPFPRFT